MKKKWKKKIKQTKAKKRKARAFTFNNRFAQF